ncbi:MAG: hypothetical protein GF398_04310 [Chitinivibrionales bacterium]|nr:hypothetical protein [Chitinivibrionales bacterium]
MSSLFMRSPIAAPKVKGGACMHNPMGSTTRDAVDGARRVWRVTSRDFLKVSALTARGRQTVRMR